MSRPRRSSWSKNKGYDFESTRQMGNPCFRKHKLNMAQGMRHRQKSHGDWWLPSNAQEFRDKLTKTLSNLGAESSKEIKFSSGPFPCDWRMASSHRSGKRTANTANEELASGILAWMVPSLCHTLPPQGAVAHGKDMSVPLQPTGKCVSCD